MVTVGNNVFSLTHIQSLLQYFKRWHLILLYTRLKDTMIDKTPEQICVEYIDFIIKTIKKLNSIKNYKLDNDDINDIRQNVITKLLGGGLAQFKGLCKLDTYIYKIIYNEIQTYLRRYEKETPVPSTVLQSNDDQDEDDAYNNFFDYFHNVNIDYTDKIFRQDIIAIIDEELSTFDYIDKLIFTWFFLCKRSQIQIAERVKLSQPTVSEHIEKIKKRLRTAIKRKYPEFEKELKS